MDAAESLKALLGRFHAEDIVAHYRSMFPNTDPQFAFDLERFVAYLRSAPPDDGEPEEAKHAPISLTLGPDGEMYYTSLNDSKCSVAGGDKCALVQVPFRFGATTAMDAACRALHEMTWYGFGYRFRSALGHMDAAEPYELPHNLIRIDDDAPEPSAWESDADDAPVAPRQRHRRQSL